MIKLFLASIFVADMTENAKNALVLMASGMVGIFVVMGILLAVVAILNRVTKNDDTEE